MDTMMGSVPGPATGTGDSDSDNELYREVLYVSEELDNTLPVDQFKAAVLALVHKMRITRWHYVAAEDAGAIKISRISGALTNAVYCITPPKSKDSAASRRGPRRKSPPQLLLRVYGTNSGKIIDRASELALLRRLARKNIGPRLLGIFGNGRFEQFLHAETLTKTSIRDPDISMAIAKRMRELHDGVELEPQERAAGPSVWANFAKWSPDAAGVLARLDALALPSSAAEPRTARDILHADWASFVRAVGVYRAWLEAEQGGGAAVARKLVFAHNDAQYGNLLRVYVPTGSPLLHPANEHRQLVVIDFEYANPNVRAYDIANHFCEWMSDYHDPERPQDIHRDRYPTAEEQGRFVDTYVAHAADSFDDIARIEAETAGLLHDADVWRPAVHAGWLLWGVVSATLPDPDAADDAFVDVPDDESLDKDEFDYLSYASQKAALFWGEMERLGLTATPEWAAAAIDYEPAAATRVGG
ncbi:kinase-like domain-containing protein [Dipodascopsis tothii]|uniref:kinase-like domain-containing protein n=1 Tax=Dipodascopsis tothii TaxID=44089 RepID=UPI0034CFD032